MENKQLKLLDFLRERTPQMPDERIKLRGAVNTNTLPIADYEVETTYKDLFIIINMLDDYADLVERNNPDKNSFYTNYMVQQFRRISNELAEQIELDKEKMYKKCANRNKEAETTGAGGLEQIFK